MNFTIDDQTLSKALTLRAENPAFENFCLRVYLAGKGCDGFDYGVCFDQKEESDLTQDLGSIVVISDPETLKFVDGSTITWVEDERGKGFLVENPKHKKFRGKFFKRKNWEQNLNQ